MLLDINSCFATIEQQANPCLRGSPVAVAAFTTPGGCILASSVEAKRLGIKTGMLVHEGKAIFPDLVVLPPDPAKYRNVHLKLRHLLSDYSPEVIPKSIDEFILVPVGRDLWSVAKKIKERIKKEIGEWITVSVGIAPNRYLAKVAAGLIKPDGLVEINKKNFLEIYSKMGLTDLTGIKTGNASRLESFGIFTVLDFYNSSTSLLKSALHSITGFYWYYRLRGYEVDQIEFGRKSFGNEVSLKITGDTDIAAIASRLFEKSEARARENGFRARRRELFVSNHKIAVRLSGLTSYSNLQLDLFGREVKKDGLEKAVDKINQKWGDFAVGSARGFKAGSLILDRIAFGKG